MRCGIYENSVVWVSEGAFSVLHYKKEKGFQESVHRKITSLSAPQGLLSPRISNESGSGESIVWRSFSLNLQKVPQQPGAKNKTKPTNQQKTYKVCF